MEYKIQLPPRGHTLLIGGFVNTRDLIALARFHVMDRTCAMQSSAELCLADAVRCYDAGEYEFARMRAIDSLRYTVGMFHPDYKKATA